jgi:sugar phosphate isomerase/epimerase
MCTKTKSPKEIGLQLYSVREDMKQDPVETVKKVGEMGYTFVEAAGYANGLFYGMTPEDFKTLVETSGMKFISSHTGQNLPDSSNYESTMAWWDQCIEAHQKAGVKYIVQPWMDKAGYATLDSLKMYCDYFNAVGEKCKEKGILFGYHNHHKEFSTLEGETIYTFMLDNTDPGKVFFQLDLYWIQEGKGDAITYFNNYPGRFRLWHVKDEKELGESGKMDFKSLFAHAQESGMEHFIVEVERYNFEPMVSIQRSLEYLQNADYIK